MTEQLEVPEAKNTPLPRRVCITGGICKHGHELPTECDGDCMLGADKLPQPVAGQPN